MPQITRSAVFHHGDWLQASYGRRGAVAPIIGTFHTSFDNLGVDPTNSYAESYWTEAGYGVRVFRDGGYFLGVFEANAAYGLYYYKGQADAICNAFHDIRSEKRIAERSELDGLDRRYRL